MVDGTSEIVSVIVALEPSILPGMAEPTPLLVHGVGIDMVEVAGIIVGVAVYMFSIVPLASR